MFETLLFLGGIVYGIGVCVTLGCLLLFYILWGALGPGDLRLGFKIVFFGLIPLLWPIVVPFWLIKLKLR